MSASTPRTRLRRASLAALASCGLIAAALNMGTASASTTATGHTPSTTATGSTPSALAAEEADARRIATVESLLGPNSTAGFYRESAGHIVVNVTDNTAAEQVRAAGAVPRMVRHSAAELNMASMALDRTARIPGTAWAMDPRANQVVVSVDETVTGSRLARLTQAVTQLGDAARMERTSGRMSLFLAGGEAMYSGNSRCSSGFNVRQADRYFTLTAGHCTAARSLWAADAGSTAEIGRSTGSSFPGNDYGIVERSNSWMPRPGSITLHNGYTQDIQNAADPYVGQPVQRSGSTTRIQGGYVQAVNATVNYPNGTVTGLVMTNACAEPGDSGGPFYSGSTALGLTSGGSGNCTDGGTTFFQPVMEVLEAYNVTVY